MLTNQIKSVILTIILLCLLLLVVYHSYYNSHFDRQTTKTQVELPYGLPGKNGQHLSAAPGNATAIAMFVHQSWKTKDLPARFVRWFSTWDVCFPDYQHRLWTDDDNLELVRTKSPDFLEQYTHFSNKIQRADSVRYLYMYHYGGIYTDLDNECLRSFQHLIDSSGCGIILGRMRYSLTKQYIQNSFMYSRPGHPFWLRVMEAMVERKDMVGAYAHNTVDITTGPKLLMHVVSKHQKTYEGTTNPGPICVFPGNYFNPYSWDIDKEGPCKDLNKMTETDLANCKIKHKKAFVIQYHTQSWSSGKV